MAKFLFLDGGGQFGVLPAMSLSRVRGLEKLSGVGGTSIGSVLAGQIATSQTPSADFFNEWMPKIFGHKRWGAPFLWTKYGDKNLNNALMSIFPGKMMCDVDIPFFCTAVDKGNSNLKVFNSKSEGDATWPLWEACRSSVSAPTYLPSWRSLVDGGLFANNPSSVGCAWAHVTLGYKYEEMEVISIGCGDIPSSGSQVSDRLLSIGPWIIEATLAGASDRMHDYLTRALPLKSYKRVNFTLQDGWKMDGVKDLKEIQEKMAKQAMDATVEIQKFIDA